MDRFGPASGDVSQASYRFGGFRLENDGTLLREGAPVLLPARELAALRLLLQRQGQVVTLLELKQALWGEEPAAPDAISKCLASLRKRLEPEDCIQTVYKRGYRFSAPAIPFGDEPPAALPRLAILPFVTEYGVPEYLGSAVAEEANHRLGAAHPPAVSILARDSVFTLAERGLTPREVGERVKANVVLAGSVRLISTHYRLRVEMIRIEDGSQLWTEDRLVDRSDLAGLETVLVELVNFRLASFRPHAPGLSIAASAEPARGQGSQKQEPKQEHLPQRREAYELFQRARHEWQSLERHRMQDALQHLLRAAELDPTLIPARIHLAHLCVAQEFYGFMPPVVAADLVRRAADSIPDLPLRAEAMLPAMGWISFHFDRNLPAALRSFTRSAHLPHDPWITRARSLFALSRHRFGEAIEFLQAAIRIDPWSAWLQARLAWVHHLAGDAPASVQLARTALDRFPGHASAQLYGATILAYNGEAGRSVGLAQDLAHRLPYFDLAAAVHAYTLAMAQRAEEARNILERLQWLSRERYATNTLTAAAYLALGESHLALAELRSANEIRCPWFFQTLADPRLKALRGLPEFDSLLGILAGMEADAEREPAEE